MHSRICEATASITADSASPEPVQSEVKLLVDEGPTRIRAKSTAIRRGVVRPTSVRPWSCCPKAECGRRNVFAGEHSVAESAIHAENFIVSETRLENQFPDQIRRGI